jgi:hypothetical protein
MLKDEAGREEEEEEEKRVSFKTKNWYIKRLGGGVK